MIDDNHFPRSPGTYGLLLHLPDKRPISVGRLGDWPFAAGYYLYVGSALGPGGLAARLGRHLRVDKRPFWHIDYLRQVGVVTAVYWRQSPERYEHQWAAAAQQLPGATIPVPRFGASDCHCAAHLFYFEKLPDLRLLRLSGGRLWKRP